MYVLLRYMYMYRLTSHMQILPRAVFNCCMQVLHKRVCEYLELDTRVEVLNTR